MRESASIREDAIAYLQYYCDAATKKTGKECGQGHISGNFECHVGKGGGKPDYDKAMETREGAIEALKKLQITNDDTHELLDPGETGMKGLRDMLKEAVSFSRETFEDDEGGDGTIEDFTPEEWGDRAKEINFIISARKTYKFKEPELDEIWEAGRKDSIEETIVIDHLLLSGDRIDRACGRGWQGSKPPGCTRGGGKGKATQKKEKPAASQQKRSAPASSKRFENMAASVGPEARKAEISRLKEGLKNKDLPKSTSKTYAAKLNAFEAVESPTSSARKAARPKRTAKAAAAPASSKRFENMAASVGPEARKAEISRLKEGLKNKDLPKSTSKIYKAKLKAFEVVEAVGSAARRSVRRRR